MSRIRVAIPVVLLCLALAANASPALAAAPADGAPNMAASSGQTDGDGGAINVRYVVYSLPEQTGRIQVTAVLEIPERVTGLSVRAPSDATVLDADELQSTGSRWEWDGQSETASLTYLLPVGMETAYGQRTAASEEWSLVVRREVSLRARWRWQKGPSPGWNETMVVPKGHEGVAGPSAVYLGPHETSVRATNAGTIQLVIPEAATLRPDRAAVLDTIAAAQRSTTIGPAHEHLLVIAVPNWLAPGGYVPANGAPVMLVSADEPVATPRNVWVHEYRHTRQYFRTSREMRWLEEGSADYYAARSTLDQGRISYERYRKRVTTDRFADADLTEPKTWSNPDTPYDKGGRVVAALDVQIRLATGGERTFADVLDRLARSSDQVTLASFTETVSAVAGEDLEAFVRDAVTGPAPPVPADPDGDGVSTKEERQQETNPYRHPDEDAQLQSGSERLRSGAGDVESAGVAAVPEQVGDSGVDDSDRGGTAQTDAPPLALFASALAVAVGLLTAALWRHRA
ncbi:M61 metallopeptidase family protein [Haloarcula amylovorans]|uniref:hypothetical protein n=1 Tax=Haloarcula amylovorans TaxID=2562280 RepID=UPI0010769D9F|nr:hypothetical protein [Halomicroarcula amylolytica]